MLFDPFQSRCGASHCYNEYYGDQQKKNIWIYILLVGTRGLRPHHPWCYPILSILWCGRVQNFFKSTSEWCPELYLFIATSHDIIQHIWKNTIFSILGCGQTRGRGWKFKRIYLRAFSWIITFHRDLTRHHATIFKKCYFYTLGRGHGRDRGWFFFETAQHFSRGLYPAIEPPYNIFWTNLFLAHFDSFWLLEWFHLVDKFCNHHFNIHHTLRYSHNNLWLTDRHPHRHIEFIYRYSSFECCPSLFGAHRGRGFSTLVFCELFLWDLLVDWFAVPKCCSRVSKRLALIQGPSSSSCLSFWSYCLLTVTQDGILFVTLSAFYFCRYHHGVFYWLPIIYNWS